ncbi:MAG TPA: hypothetical protein VMU28_04170 [Terriglobales bacterium]|nr:hypothetical protein [Terriglobales bacterium]
MAAEKAYNVQFTMRAQSIAKSLLLGFAGAGLVSFFLMMAAIPIMALLQRLAGNVAQQSEVVNIGAFMRTYGLSVAVLAFLASFILGMVRFWRHEHMAGSGT